MLTAVESNDRSWQDSLGDVQIAINNTVNRTTKASPLELWIGKVPRPLSLMIADEIESDIDLKSIRDNALCNIQKAALYENVNSIGQRQISLWETLC